MENPKKASWPGFLASGKDSRTKVVLARKIGKQGLGGTPDCIPLLLRDGIPEQKLPKYRHCLN